MSKIIRHIAGGADGVHRRAASAIRWPRSRPSERLGELFPEVSIRSPTPDGAKLIPDCGSTEVRRRLNRECEEARQAGVRRRATKPGCRKGWTRPGRCCAQFDQAIKDAVSQRETLLEEAKPKVLELVLQISRKVTFDAVEVDQEATVSMIDGVIDQLVDRSRPQDSKSIPIICRSSSRISIGFCTGSTTIKEITFEADPRVQYGGCFIETPTGDIDARLDSQFDVIDDALAAEEERRELCSVRHVRRPHRPRQHDQAVRQSHPGRRVW